MRRREGSVPEETMTVQRLGPNTEHSKPQDLEDNQYDQLEESAGEVAKDRLEQCLEAL